MPFAGGGPNVRRVDRADALELLPDVYAEALRLHDAGCGHAEIAERLEIAPEGVATSLELAEAKLARLMAQSETASPRIGGAPGAP